MDAAGIATVLAGLTALLMAYVAYRKAASESFATTGAEWRELVKELKVEYGNLKERADSLEAKVDLLEKTVVEKNQEISDLTSRVTTMTNENANLEGKVEKLQQENVSLRERVTHLEALNAELTFTVERLEAEKKELEARVVANQGTTS